MGYVQSYRAPASVRELMANDADPNHTILRIAYGNRALGFFIVDDLLAVAGAVKGIQAIVSSAQGAFGSGGKTTDQQRQARAAYFGQSALAGSVTAARYLLGGLHYTASHEQPYYQSWINNLANDSLGTIVLAQAEAQGPKWADGVPDPGGTQQMFEDVKQDLLVLGKPAPAIPGSMPTTRSTPPIARPTGTVQQLPPMTTTAPYNWTPWIIAGVGGLAVLAAVGSSSSSRRVV